MTATSHPQPFLLSDAGRSMGLCISGGRGSGKTTLEALIAFEDCVRGVPTLILDPLGTVSSALLERLALLPEAYQRIVGERLRYIDAAASEGYTCGWPLYKREEEESLYQISQRVLEVWRRADPALQEASIYGYNALEEVGTNAGIILAALGLQITEAAELVLRPHTWVPQLEEAVHRFPEAAEAAAYFAAIETPDRRYLETATTFLRKVAPFRLNPAFRAIYGSETTGINWSEVVERRLCVMIDLKHLEEVSARRFYLLWVMASLMRFLRRRGSGRHLRPLSLIIDEFTFITSIQAHNSSLIVDDLHELMDRLSRNAMLWLTISFQSLDQFSEAIRAALLRLGTQVIGNVAEPAIAHKLAERFFPYNPAWYKRYEPVWHTDSWGRVRVIDERPIDLSIEEQRALTSRRIMTLPAFHFLTARAMREGTLPHRLEPMTIKPLLPHARVETQQIALICRRLQERDWQPIASVLEQINGRGISPPSLPTVQVKRRRSLRRDEPRDTSS